MAPRLKVFTWSNGFHAFSIATSSRPKALKAWGSKQDLFASGLASELSGGPDHDAALASPGEVIERVLAVEIGKIGKAAQPRRASASDTARKQKLMALETRLADLDTAQVATLAKLEQAEHRIGAERDKVQTDYRSQRAALVRDLKAARR